MSDIKGYFPRGRTVVEFASTGNLSGYDANGNEVLVPISGLGFASSGDIAAAIAALVAGAPGGLNTLDELAAAIADDPAFFMTVATALATKAPLAAADREFAFFLPGGGQVLSITNPADPRDFLRVRVASHLKGWHVLCDVSGSLALDIQTVSYASYPSFATLGTTNPSLSSVIKAENTSLNVALAAGTYIRVVPTGTATSITWAVIFLDVTAD